MQHHLVVQDCFNAVLRLRQNGHDESLAQDAHTFLKATLMRMLEAPEGMGLAPEDAQDHAFVLAAFADEVAMRCADAVALFWRHQALQTILFDNFDAGELFFERLAVIERKPHKQAVLSSYYTALVLGYEGRLSTLGGRPERLRLMAQLRRALFASQPTGATTLAPDALCMRAKPPSSRRLSAPTALLIGLCFLAAAQRFGMQAMLHKQMLEVVTLANMREPAPRSHSLEPKEAP